MRGISDTGATPLHNAASWGRADAVRLLFKRGADAGIANKSGSTPLQAAVENDQPGNSRNFNSGSRPQIIGE